MPREGQSAVMPLTVGASKTGRLEIFPPRRCFITVNQSFLSGSEIRIVLRGAFRVVPKIYILLGEEIRTLVSEKLPAGTHRRVWEAKGLPSGLYLYRLQAGAPSTSSPTKSGQAGRVFVRTKKLILLR